MGHPKNWLTQPSDPHMLITMFIITYIGRHLLYLEVIYLGNSKFIWRSLLYTVSYLLYRVSVYQYWPNGLTQDPLGQPIKTRSGPRVMPRWPSPAQQLGWAGWVLGCRVGFASLIMRVWHTAQAIPYWHRDLISHFLSIWSKVPGTSSVRTDATATPESQTALIQINNEITTVSVDCFYQTLSSESLRASSWTQKILDTCCNNCLNHLSQSLQQCDGLPESGQLIVIFLWLSESHSMGCLEDLGIVLSVKTAISWELIILRSWACPWFLGPCWAKTERTESSSSE